MPLKLLLKLGLSEEVDTKDLTPDRAHGLFFSLAGEEVAEIFHNGYRNVKPFSLFCRELFRPHKVKGLTLEVNLLEDSLIPKFLSGFILNRKRTFLTLNSKRVGVELEELKTPAKWLKPYSSLAEVKEYPAKVEVAFLSPTTFRRNDTDMPFPLAELLFKGLVKRWRTFSPVPIGVDLREYYPLVEIERYKLGTQKVEFSNGGKLTTFVGSIVYNLKRVENKEALRWFGILLNFSQWSGVGRKSTMGLGKVRIEKL